MGAWDTGWPSWSTLITAESPEPSMVPESGEAAFEVHIWPERLVVENGGSRTVNCSTSCANPDTGGLETTLEKTLLEDQPRWKSFWISNVSWDTVLFCYFTCAGEQQSKSLNVSMYQFPKQIILQLQPVWVTLGKPFTIECRVSAVKPLESLTLTLLRGKETLHSQTFSGGATDPQEARVTFNSTASKEDGLLNFSCQAELDLRSRGGDILRNISENKVLQVYDAYKTQGRILVHLDSHIQLLDQPLWARGLARHER
ncbi:intercellular adhesion molecule 2 isoform X2 [Marmota marmota marmota]|uniref:intercellular adhesion molecule 2 isoform X2 n=1 Tax=Marmota marmota marmota TaxID=9994 RepID=UPI00209308BE|nr:intercellular adhesion molecule 2 isoform X2 [Marmota marmota marmota]